MNFLFGILFFVLNVLDGVLTLWAVQLESGYHVELNPLMRALMNSIGNWFFTSKDYNRNSCGVTCFKVLE